MVWYLIWYNHWSYVHTHTHTFYKTLCDYVYGLACDIRIRLQNLKLKTYDCKPCVFGIYKIGEYIIKYSFGIWFCTTASLGLNEQKLIKYLIKLRKVISHEPTNNLWENWMTFYVLPKYRVGLVSTLYLLLSNSLMYRNLRRRVNGAHI